MPPSCKQGHYLAIGGKQSRQFLQFPALALVVEDDLQVDAERPGEEGGPPNR